MKQIFTLLFLIFNAHFLNALENIDPNPQSQAENSNRQRMQSKMQPQKDPFELRRDERNEKVFKFSNLNFRSKLRDKNIKITEEDLKAELKDLLNAVEQRNTEKAVEILNLFPFLINVQNQNATSLFVYVLQTSSIEMIQLFIRYVNCNINGWGFFNETDRFGVSLRDLLTETKDENEVLFSFDGLKFKLR